MLIEQSILYNDQVINMINNPMLPIRKQLAYTSGNPLECGDIMKGNVTAINNLRAHERQITLNCLVRVISINKRKSDGRRDIF